MQKPCAVCRTPVSMKRGRPPKVILCDEHKDGPIPVETGAEPVSAGTEEVLEVSTDEDPKDSTATQ